MYSYLAFNLRILRETFGRNNFISKKQKNNPMKSSSIDKFCLLLLTLAIFCWPVCIEANDFDQKIHKIVVNFAQQIQSTIGDQEYFLAVRSFFDEATYKPSRRSEEIRDTIFHIIRNRYRGNSKIIILNWRSEKPFEKNTASTTDAITYKQGMLAEQLLKDFGKGFLITGTTAIIADAAEIKTELIDMQSGQVLMSLNTSLPLSAEEVMLAKKTTPSKQVETAESAPTPQTEPEPSAMRGAGDLGAPQAPGPQPAAADDTATAAKTDVAEIKAAPEAEREDLEYKVIEGVNFKYEGYIKDGKKHGQGTLTFTSGDKYVGQWRNDQKHGQGTYIFADGEKYVGQWQDNKMHGQGTYFFKSGNKYAGQWQNDKKHGQGTYFFKNGDKWEGTYSNNKKHGYGVYTWASGKATKEYWQDGKLVE